ncbi:MAG TPA: pyruvate kinase [Bryobacteraceae bacterium]|nr:pyruvate kinase [Bryobacteraceae bacterium]
MPVPAAQHITALLAELQDLRQSCLAMEQEFGTSIAEACPETRRSVQNLFHYLALRKHDLRDLQSRLAALGLSSLGRSESSALAGIEAIIAILQSLAGERCFDPLPNGTCVDFQTGSAILAERADQLLGPVPESRAVRVMVTMPSEAAHSYELVKGLVDAGMDVMRVNCAHDSEREWDCMIAHMRRANQESGKQCKVLMDLAGPKLRTGPIHRGYHVVRWRVDKDARGVAAAPAHVALVGKNAGLAGSESVPPSDVRLPVTDTLLRSVRVGDTLQITDSRKRKRQLTVIYKADHVCVGTCKQGAYILSRAKLALVRGGREFAKSRVGELPFVEEPIRLHPRDLLVLTKEENISVAAHRDVPHISCTLPEAFSTAQADQPIFFDDGKIEGRIREVHPDHMLIEIVHTAASGAKLGSAKGINLPETDLGIDAMTAKDRSDLDFVAQHADIVGLSFVRRPEDVLELQQELTARGKSGLGIILKIESQQGFDQLPLIMIAALRHHPVGIMVARGDLAIEIGFERLAEVQEEILWLSEAAHIPVVWATQVLETLAKTGIPSRAEVTDAAMGVRAECVMLNKGEHIVDAVRFLDHVLQRMQAHQLKKRSMLRRLAVAQVKHTASPAS